MGVVEGTRDVEAAGDVCPAKRSIVEARKLEHHYPRALKVKYKES